MCVHYARMKEAVAYLKLCKMSGSQCKLLAKRVQADDCEIPFDLNNVRNVVCY